MAIDPELLQYLIDQKVYLLIREVPGRGLCVVQRLIWHTGLYYGTTRYEKGQGHYCYPSPIEAMAALLQWDGIGDPPGPWDLHKTRTGKYHNPLLKN